ncbi:NtaA/DmoA family FMN-dependent monooxygenase [Kineococcus rhizosphaerae]|uniref:FMN-dependent oxidoreductase (Nitrilotriacetate monooxygenase family) n=1 Tax=Kineococcus rhizosphaerae TaxID=559628 RepID=A0A2T0QYB9_9ACTN|nr:NtaA/DmoA family FMN-dependent monooxygenase [Kineococcus rhizosphaerae]PRY11187.1 FMN-dependent oxidoreductase (nitrilotriacetate monooxygenase family) [Kineococcus rhizosphaerae]
MHLGWFATTGFGVYGWNQPWSGNQPQDLGKPGLFVDMATTLERAGFDYIMLEDSSVLPDVFRGTFESSVKRGVQVRFDPLPLVPLMAAATRHIGIVATVATSFYPPFLAARLFQTLDHVTGGRVGMNLVTASADGAAQNYGMDKHIQHDLRYEMADEWVEVCRKLWASWEPDALVLDPESGVFADHTKIHTVDHVGEHYRSRGPLNLPMGPQGGPVLCQAGASPAGRAFGARHADTIIAAQTGIEAMRDYKLDITKRLVDNGRGADDAKVLFLVNPILGDTDDEALAKRDRLRETQRANVDGVLAAMSYFTSTDFSQFDVDAPLPDLSGNNGHQGTVADMVRSGKTLREIVTNHRTTESVELCGTPDTVAERMGEIMEEVGGDGFLIAAPVTRKNLTEIGDGLAPALRRRGLLRTEYPHRTFRENLLSA